jgi:two-component system nitrogen regulation response regulator NtrX
MTREARILIVDDEKNIRRTLRMVLEGEGYEVREAETGEEALRLAGEALPDVVLLDVRLPGMDGHATLEKLRDKVGPEVAVIMISGHATIADAVQATKTGAFDFLEKPIDRERLLVSVRNALEHRTLQSRVQELESRLDASTEMLGESPPMQRIFKEIQKVAPTKGRVLITGESGTGKELIARAIHRLSPRAKGPFVKVNCAAIPSELIESELFGHEKGAFTGAVARKRGQFELADGGTILLDEIGDMSLSAQAKVLRVLQTGEVVRVGSETAIQVDVRVIAATNKDLDRAVQEGRFREDLYFRLNVVPLHAPPLRERPGDLPILVNAFVARFCKEHGFRKKEVTPAVMARLAAYPWPGNVRELKNIIERMVIMSDQVIDVQDLPEDLFRTRVRAGLGSGLPGTLREFKEEVERRFLLEKLAENDWNISRTAEALGIERTNLHKKIRHFGLSRGETP